MHEMRAAAAGRRGAVPDQRGGEAGNRGVPAAGRGGRAVCDDDDGAQGAEPAQVPDAQHERVPAGPEAAGLGRVRPGFQGHLGQAEPRCRCEEGVADVGDDAPADDGVVPQGDRHPIHARPPPRPQALRRSGRRRQYLHCHRARAWRLPLRSDPHQAAPQARGCDRDRNRRVQRHDLPPLHGHYPPRPEARQPLDGGRGVSKRPPTSGEGGRLWACTCPGHRTDHDGRDRDEPVHGAGGLEVGAV
mmetsp:Transcript_28170/g.66676  ORF Transcript_28170/g.66676 Transcript_28170/m.66676 type:complete len:245 (+) Transcript_28170:243-977(+)